VRSAETREVAMICWSTTAGLGFVQQGSGGGGGGGGMREGE